MAYTGTEIFERSIVIIDELSDSGTVTDSLTREYKNRAPALLDLWQHEEADLQATAEILRKPAVNLLGHRFEIQEHAAEDVTFETTASARSAAFTVENQADVYIENYEGGAWVYADGYYSADGAAEVSFSGLISISALSSPASYKCRFTAAGDKTRLRFSGDYYYLFSDFALFEAAFPSCTRVPEYGEYVKYAMPSNFDSFTQIVTESPRAGLYHKWENGNLMVNYFYEGTIKITYRPNPIKITALTQTLEVSEGSAAAAAYYLAMHFALADMNTELASICSSKYQEIKALNKKKPPLAPAKINDAYNISGLR